MWPDALDCVAVCLLHQLCILCVRTNRNIVTSIGAGVPVTECVQTGLASMWFLVSRGDGQPYHGAALHPSGTFVPPSRTRKCLHA